MIRIILKYNRYFNFKGSNQIVTEMKCFILPGTIDWITRFELLSHCVNTHVFYGATYRSLFWHTCNSTCETICSVTTNQTDSCQWKMLCYLALQITMVSFLWCYTNYKIGELCVGYAILHNLNEQSILLPLC